MKKQTDWEKIIELIPEDKKKIATDLIREVVFMAQVLTNLQNTIVEKGEMDRFEQGKQNFIRENPALKSYNTTIQRYGSIYKQIIDLIPKIKDKPEEEDSFNTFVNGRDDD